MAESATPTALAVYSFIDKKPLKRSGLSHAFVNTQLKQCVNERSVGAKHAVAGRGLAFSSLLRATAIDRGKAAFQAHKIVGGDQNRGHSGMRLAVKGRE